MRNKIASIALLVLFVLSTLLVHQMNVVPHASPATPVHNVSTGLNYTTIQAAIDDPETLDGQTIDCDAGNYTENVKVYKSLSIIGAGPSLAWIIPFETDDTWHVTASNVTIEGFTVQSVSGYSAIRLDNVGDCCISNNTITGGGGGITLSGSSGNTVSNDVILSQRGNGIWLTDSSQWNTIANNSLNLNHYGIVLWNASNYNVIEDNFVNSSDWSGIRLNWQGSNYAPASFNNITDNIVTNNGGEGIFLDTPSLYNLLDDNFLSDNYIGIRLRQVNSSTVIQNTVISNSYLGISAESSYSNTFYDNFLNNTNNAWDNGVNSWNITKQTGSNIIGGPYIGGNYWSDNPNTTDINGDGIGDVPYNVAGGANIDYLPLVTPLPIFIAQFMTPEGEPYPFDDFTVSNGTWEREFVGITHGVTLAPINATFTFAYTYGASCGMTYRCILPLSLGEIRLFKVYALNLTLMEVGKPYVWLEEEGANSGNLAWNWNASNGTFNWSLSCQPGKRVGVEMNIGENSVITNSQALVLIYDHMPPTYNPPGYPGAVYVNGSWVTYSPSQPIQDGMIGDSGNFAILPAPPYGFVKIEGILHNDTLLPANCSLQNVNGTLYSRLVFPDYAVSANGEANCILSVFALPNGYTPLNLPVRVVSSEKVDFEIYPPLQSELGPYTFLIAAQNTYAKSSYSDLIQNLTSKTITVNVSTGVSQDWWGCFVLPKDRWVRTLTAYSGSASYQLRKLYNYTEQIVGDYDIVAVRIPPQMDRLNCTYTVFGDINGDGKIDGRDLVLIAKCFGSHLGDARYNPNCDINNDGKVDGRDITIVAKYFGRHDP